MSWYWFIPLVLVAYLIGSLSFSSIVSKIHGVDIFMVGSGNAGAANVNRSVGKCAARIVFVLDFLKGLIPTAIAMKAFPEDCDLNIKSSLMVLIGVICGHSFSIFHDFRGGKGISSTMGGLLIVMPGTLVVGALVWCVIFNATRIVSIASLCFSASVLLTAYLFSYQRECVLFAIAMNVVIFWKHRANILRLMKGTEYKFTKND
jgi:glycerol-3-phosphate acyltransferase PlsY